jgi:hypothetical protein
VVLKYTGEPIRVPYNCSEDELQAAGLVCTEAEPCSIYLELSTLAPSGRKLFLGGNLHAEAGTLTSILLASDDGGATWKEPIPRIHGAALEQIQIYDLSHGWAAGEVQVPLPNDPFFLVTTDGGQTWRRRPVSDEGGPGSIHQFWFDSAQHGELIIDAGKSAPGGRYGTWESETGGESWMVRAATPKQAKMLFEFTPRLQATAIRLKNASMKNGKSSHLSLLRLLPAVSNRRKLRNRPRSPTHPSQKTTWKS